MNGRARQGTPPPRRATKASNWSSLRAANGRRRAVRISLRAHPLAFLRDELTRRRMISCSQLRSVKDGRYVELAGIVLVRQKPGSAKGVMFITIEDETDVANRVVWTKIFEANRRTVLGASMMGVRGQVPREGEVIHITARRLDDLSPLLASVGNRADVADIYRVSRADVVKNPLAPIRVIGLPIRSAVRREKFLPDLRLGSGIIPGQPIEGIKVRTRDFR
jgi:error-prone DNA polymerase